MSFWYVREQQCECGQFMYFEPITFIPMDLDAANPDILSSEDKKLLNDYHKKVYEKVSPYLNDEEKEWLKKYTSRDLIYVQSDAASENNL